MNNVNVKDLTENLTVFADKIFVFKNVINLMENWPKELEDLDSRFEDEATFNVKGNPVKQLSPWNPWPANDDPEYLYGRTKTGHFIYNHSNEPSGGDLIAYDLVEVIRKAAEELAEKYFKKLDIKEIPHLPSTFEIKEYNTGADMGPHFDDYPGNDNQTILSAVLYMNDDYEGGELAFTQHDITIKPEAGCLIFFPSTSDYIHQSKIIESGKKYCVPLFYYKNAPVSISDDKG